VLLLIFVCQATSHARESTAAQPPSEPVPSQASERADESAPDTPPADFEDEGPLEPAATQRPEPEEEGKPGLVMQALERSQRLLSEEVVRLSRRMDLMLGARQIYPEDEYNSVLRLRLIEHIEEGGSALQPDVSGKLALPGTENRLGLYFTSEDYPNPLDRERGTERELSATAPRTKSLDLSYLKAFEHWETALSAGVRTAGLSSPLNLVFRGRMWRQYDIDAWIMRPRETVFWYTERGTGASTELRFDHPIAELSLFRSESSVTWFQRDTTFYYDQVFSVLQPLSSRDELLWQIGAQGQSQPNTHLENYYFQVRLRHQTYRDWLIFEITPQLFQQAQFDFHTERRIFVGFELLFGGPGSY
jgi:hypothetical protein